MKTISRPNWHTVIDARSRELHQLVAAKIRKNPNLLKTVKATLNRWLREARDSERAYDTLMEWKRLIEDKSLRDVLNLISSDGEAACRLRQSTPFVGILTQSERTAIFRKYEAFRS